MRHHIRLYADELEDLLKTKAKQLIEEKQTLGSDMRKDIRILDFLKFGINYHKKSAPPQSSPSAPSSEEKKPDKSAGRHHHRTQTTRDSPKSTYSLTQKKTK